MFDTDQLAGLPTRALLDATVENRLRTQQVECERLLLAAAFADGEERDPECDTRAARSSIDWDGGRSAIDEDVVAEFGACLGMGFGAARALIASAVAIRWRMPILWSRVREGSVPGWQAQRFAERCQALTYDQAFELDRQLSAVVGMINWGRFGRRLEAAILEIDAVRLAARAEQARTERYVRTVASDVGLKTMIIKANAGDVIWLEAAIIRIAEILAAAGDTDSEDVRRSKAAGILANPAGALALLAAHAGPDVVAPGEDAHISLSSELPAALSGRLDPKTVAPRTVLYFHLSEAALDPGFGCDPVDGTPSAPGLVRPEHGEPLSLGQLRDFLADTGCTVTVRPVVTPAAEAPADGYEIPARLRTAVRLRNIVDVFPYSGCDRARMDLDHTEPWGPGGPPGQTGLHNLAPVSRSSHRMATPRIRRSRRGAQVTGRWRKRQPVPGTLVWKSPHGRVFLSLPTGTADLGDTAFAARVWGSARAATTTAA